MLTSQITGEEVLKRNVPEENWVTNWFIKGKGEEVKGNFSSECGPLGFAELSERLPLEAGVRSAE